MVSPLIRPYFLEGGSIGGPPYIDSHDLMKRNPFLTFMNSIGFRPNLPGPFHQTGNSMCFCLILSLIFFERFLEIDMCHGLNYHYFHIIGDKLINPSL